MTYLLVSLIVLFIGVLFAIVGCNVMHCVCLSLPMLKKCGVFKLILNGRMKQLVLDISLRYIVLNLALKSGASKRCPVSKHVTSMNKQTNKGMKEQTDGHMD